jgi:hypothetical protein
MASRYPEPTRRDDERLLQALRLIERGHSYAAVAKALGIARNALIGQVKRVRKAGKE